MEAKSLQSARQSSVLKAVEAVRLGIPLRRASSTYGVPRSTIHNKLKNIHPVDATKGPASVLSPDEEELLVMSIFHSTDKGFPVTKDQLFDSVKLLMKELKFTNNRPGRH